MQQWILSLLILSTLHLTALEISIDSGVEDHQRYSILHLKDTQSFVCEAIKDDFLITTKIVCAYSKKPDKIIHKLQNDFFKIDTMIQKETFFLVITPFYKIKLVPQVFDLTQDNSVYEPNVTLSDYWMVIGYKEKLPLIHKDETSEIGINFPFFMDKDKLPYVGSLDIKGNPVYIKKVEDVTDYLRIKKLYAKGNYEQCLDLIDTVLDEYPNTLFKAELTYYKIKVYKQLKDNDNVIDYAKLFLREYSSDENVAEVLSLIAQAYSLIGQNGDADYFFDRLFSEHAQSVYAQWGYIYKGEMLEESGGISVAIKFYKRALKETQNLDVAVNAAFNLVKIYMTDSQKEAVKYMEKIIKAKPSFLYEHFKKSKEMMYTFADSSKYEIAAKMAKVLLASMPKDDENYENILKDRALWLSKTENKDEALKAINEYFKAYPDGEYLDIIQVAKDSLFFDQKDINATRKLQEYDKLIDDYAGDSIGERAIYEKAKLLLESKHYLAFLDFKDKLESLDEEIYKDIPQMIHEAAIGAMENSLKKKECHNVLRISKDYNITLSDKWDDGIYECGMKGGDYQLSRQVATRNLNSKDLDQRKKWLYRYIKIDFTTGNYSDVIEASKDLITLIEGSKEEPYVEVYRYLFDTYERLEKSDEMIDAIANIQKVFGLDYKDLDRYVAMVSLGSDRNDDTIIIKYGEEALKIQKASKSHPQSPYLEFTLYQAYMNLKEYEKALDVIESLNDVTLDKTKRARQKYLLGTVLSKLWRDTKAQKAYQEAIDADPASPWADLAKSAKEI